MIATALAIFFLLPVPALGFTLVGQWSFTTTVLNAPNPIVSSRDTGTSATKLTVDMGFNPITTSGGPPGSNPGGLAYLTATRNITVLGNEQVQVGQDYQTLLQGAGLQTVVYFQNTANPLATGRINVTPNQLNTAGIRFGHTYTLVSSQTVDLSPGSYTIVVRMRYKKDRMGLWDNSNPMPGSPHSFSFSSAAL
jgi:hypothetical protein